jgi:DNA replication and checkpoint protein
MGRLSISELQNRKRELKQRLKEYDMNFARRHGRMPVKAEKEPIRHLYERYNALKTQITTMEQEGRQSASPAATQQSAAAAAASSSAIMSQRTTVTPVGSDSEDSGPGGMRIRPVSSRASVATTSSLSSGASSAGAPTQENLAALKTEKGRLHQMLRSYEKDFFREHQRQVSSFADIRPVASQYRRYKEIKKEIARLQQNSADGR